MFLAFCLIVGIGSHVFSAPMTPEDTNNGFMAITVLCLVLVFGLLFLIGEREG